MTKEGSQNGVPLVINFTPDYGDWEVQNEGHLLVTTGSWCWSGSQMIVSWAGDGRERVPVGLWLSVPRWGSWLLVPGMSRWLWVPRGGSRLWVPGMGSRLRIPGWGSRLSVPCWSRWLGVPVRVPVVVSMRGHWVLVVQGGVVAVRVRRAGLGVHASWETGGFLVLGSCHCYGS